MRETDLGSTEKQYMSLTENIAANGPMDERKAMDLARALCSRMLDESGITEADLTAFHPDTILLSPEGTISFSGDTVPESAKEAYLPPEYVKGATSKESIVIYGLGILLLFLVTGQEKGDRDREHLRPGGVREPLRESEFRGRRVRGHGRRIDLFCLRRVCLPDGSLQRGNGLPFRT